MTLTLVKIKRIYEKPSMDDGRRILVDRLWPRGISKNNANIDLWLKEIAPSDSLRKWFAHRPERWKEFKSRYLKEIKNKKDLLMELKELTRKGVVTLIYSSKDKNKNNARVLLELITRN